MLFDIVRVGFLDIKKIFVGNVLFVGTVTLLDIYLQLVYRGVQIDKYIRLNKLLVDDIK